MNLKVIVRSSFLAAISCVSLHATAISSPQISLTSFQIVPTAGTFTLLSPWMATAFAQGQNSLGELLQQFDGPGLKASATATVTYVTASGSADANLLTAGASSMLDIPGMSLLAANGTGQSTLTSMFEITGGTGPVNVQYIADVTRILSLSTDAFGQSAQAEVVFNLLQDGNTVLFSDDLSSIGPNSSFSSTISGIQSQIETLQYNTPYSLVLELDAESSGINAPSSVPEPATIWLVIGPLGLSLAARRLRIFHRYFG